MLVLQFGTCTSTVNKVTALRLVVTGITEDLSNGDLYMISHSASMLISSNMYSIGNRCVLCLYPA